jgi:hypothetical protein
MVIGDWLEGLVTFNVLTRGCEEFKVGGAFKAFQEPEGSRFGMWRSSFAISSATLIAPKRKPAGGSRHWRKHSAISIGANYLRNSRVLDRLFIVS